MPCTHCQNPAACESVCQASLPKDDGTNVYTPKPGQMIAVQDSEGNLCGEVLRASGAAPADPLERCRQIRERVAELEAEVKRLEAEHNALLGTGVVDADDIAWATGKDGVSPSDGE